MEALFQILAEQHSFSPKNPTNLPPHPGFKFQPLSEKAPLFLVSLACLLERMLEDQKEKTSSKGELVALIDSGIFGPKKKKKETLQELKRKNPPVGSLCRKSMTTRDIGYKCLDCEKDNTCIICEECFLHGDHSGHRVFKQHGSFGICDCGDPDAWETKGFCSKHKGFLTEEDIRQFDFPKSLKENIKMVIGSISFCFGQLCEEIYLASETFNTSQLRATSNSLLSVTVEALRDSHSLSHVLSYLIMSALKTPLSCLGDSSFQVRLRHSCNDLMEVCSGNKGLKECSCSFVEILMRFSKALSNKNLEEIQDFFILFFNFLDFKSFLGLSYIKLYKLFFDFRTPKSDSEVSIKSFHFENIELQIFTSNEFALQAIKCPNFVNVFDVFETLTSRISACFDFSGDQKWLELAKGDFYIHFYIVLNFLRTVITMNPLATISFLSNEKLMQKAISVFANFQRAFGFHFRSKMIRESGKFTKILGNYVLTIKQLTKLIHAFIESANKSKDLIQRKIVLKKLIHLIFKHYELNPPSSSHSFSVYYPLHFLFVIAVHSLCSLKETTSPSSASSQFLVVFPKPTEVQSLLESLEASNYKEALREMAKEAATAHSFCTMALRGAVKYDTSISDLCSLYSDSFYFMEIQTVQMAIALHEKNEWSFPEEIIKRFLVSFEKDLGYEALIVPAIQCDFPLFSKAACDPENSQSLGMLRSLLEFCSSILLDSHSFFGVVASVTGELDLVYNADLVERIMRPTLNSLLFVHGPMKFKELTALLKAIWHLPKSIPSKFLETIERITLFDQSSQLFKVKNEKETFDFFAIDAFLSVPRIHGAFIEAANKNPTLLKSPGALFLGSQMHFSLERPDENSDLQQKCLSNAGNSEKFLRIFISLLEASLESEKLLEISRLSLGVILRMGLLDPATFFENYWRILRKMSNGPSEEVKEASKTFSILFEKIKRPLGYLMEETKEMEVEVDQGSSLSDKRKEKAKKIQESLRKQFQQRLKMSKPLFEEASSCFEVNKSPSLLSKRSGTHQNGYPLPETENCVFCLGEISRETDQLLRFGLVQLSNVLSFKRRQDSGYTPPSKAIMMGEAMECEKTGGTVGFLYYSGCSHLIHKACSREFLAKESLSKTDFSDFRVCPQCRVLSNLFVPLCDPKCNNSLPQIQKEKMEFECDTLGLLLESLKKAEKPWDPVFLRSNGEPEEQKETAGVPFEIEKSKGLMEEEDDFIQMIFAGILSMHPWFHPQNGSLILSIKDSFGHFAHMVDLTDFQTLLTKNLPIYQDLFQHFRRMTQSPNRKDFPELWLACCSQLKDTIPRLLYSRFEEQLELDVDGLFTQSFFDLHWILEDQKERKLVASELVRVCLGIKTKQLVAGFSRELFGKTGEETKQCFYQAKGLLLGFLKKASLCNLIQSGTGQSTAERESELICLQKIKSVLVPGSGGAEDSEQVEQLLDLLSVSLPELPSDICEWLVPLEKTPAQVAHLRSPSFFRFISLPADFKEFSSFYLHKKCSVCRKNSQNPLMVCLICGEAICLRSCNESSKKLLFGLTGNCTQHANSVHCGSSLFVSSGDASVLLVGGERSFFVGEIYSDKYGQSINETLRSISGDLASLKLNQKAIQRFLLMVTSHSIPAEITSLIGKKGRTFISL